MVTKNRKLGNMGEAIAMKYLLRKGYEFVDKNIHAQGGEIDLLMKDPSRDFYFLVEVKTRRNDAFGDIRTTITKSKIKKMLSAAEHYFCDIKGLHTLPHFQIDAVLLKLDGQKMMVEHIENIGFGDF